MFLVMAGVYGIATGRLHTQSLHSSLAQDYSYRLSLVISEQTSQLQELRRELSFKEQELHELKQEKEREMGGKTEHLQSLLKEKEAFIKVILDAFPLAFPLAPAILNMLCLINQELMQGQEEVMQSSSKESEADMNVLQEELQLVLKKEREAQVSVWTL